MACKFGTLASKLQPGELFEIFKMESWIRLDRKSGFLSLRHIPQIGGKFKTLTFKIRGLGVELFTRNHKSIDIDE